MFKKRKGSNSGMPIIAVVGVIASLAGMGVIFGLVGNISTQTGQDHDRRALNDLGAAIENKCTDVSGDTSTGSVTAINVEVELKSDVELQTTNTTENGPERTTGLYLEFAGDSNEEYSLPDGTCDIYVRGLPLGPGQYAAEVSYESSGGPSGDTDDEPNIIVSVE